MKMYSQPQQIISILISFIFIIEFSGCYTTRTIQTSEISPTDKYIIHTSEASYQADVIKVSGDMITCRLDLSKIKNNRTSKTHIYLSSDTVLKLNNDLIYLSAKNITKIDQKVPDPRKTKTLVAVIVISACVGLTIGIYAMIASIASGVSTMAAPANSSTGLCSNW